MCIITNPEQTNNKIKNAVIILLHSLNRISNNWIICMNYSSG